MSYTPFYPQWLDWPNVTTPVTAAAMQHIEDGIVANMSASGEIDGGSSISDYLISQVISGGGA